MGHFFVLNDMCKANGGVVINKETVIGNHTSPFAGKLGNVDVETMAHILLEAMKRMGMMFGKKVTVSVINETIDDLAKRDLLHARLSTFPDQSAQVIWHMEKRGILTVHKKGDSRM